MLTPEQVSKITEIIRECADIKPDALIEPTDNLYLDLGMDEYERTKMTCELEDEFRITIPAGDEGRFRTVQEVYEYIERNR